MKKRHKKMSRGQKVWRRIKAKPFVFVAIFVLAGLALLLATQAASPIAFFEGEAAIKSGGAISKSDASASSGQYLEFGGTQTTPPPPTPPPGPNPTVNMGPCGDSKHLSNNGASIRSGFPGPKTTGPKVVPTKTHSGNLTITQNGAVYDGYTISGYILVKASNVTIRNSVVYGQANFVIDNSEGGSMVIEDSVVCGYGTRASAEFSSPCDAVIGAGNYIVRRSNLSGCNDIFKASGNSEVYDSYTHDNYTYRLGNGDGTHNDTVQMRGTTLPKLIFSGNAVYEDSCTSNRHFQLAPTQSPNSGGQLRIVDNFFYGIKVINIDRGLRFSDGQMSGNTYAGASNRGPFSGAPSAHMYSGDGMGSVRVSANVWEQGGSANSNPPSGYTCVGG